MKHTTYGQKGGEGPTRGLKATIYSVTLPDGEVLRKRVFKDLGATATATGCEAENGYKRCVVVWEGAPAWEGDFGRLVATRLEKKE